MAQAQLSTRRKKVIIASIITLVFIAVVAVSVLVVYNQWTTLPSPSPSPTPSLTPAPTQITLGFMRQVEIVQGNSSQIQIYVTSIGKAENIKLSSSTNSNDINCTFEPSTGISNFTSTLIVSAADSTPTGNYALSITASGEGRTVNASGILSVLSANVTVSGQANSAALSMPFPSSLIKIEFTDTQTGANVSFDFPVNYPSQIGNNGNGASIQNYSVTLAEGHTYSVAISYYLGPLAPGNISEKTDYVGNFTVYAAAGQTTISKDFG